MSTYESTYATTVPAHRAPISTAAPHAWLGRPGGGAPTTALEWRTAPEDVTAMVTTHARTVAPGRWLELRVSGRADVYAIHDALRCLGFSRIRTWVSVSEDGSSGATGLRVTARQAEEINEEEQSC